jgi:hypothetical protein
VSAATNSFAVQDLFNFIFAVLSRIGHRTGGRSAARASVVRFQSLHVNRRAALKALWKSQGVGVRTCEGSDAKGTFPSRSELSDLCSIKQLLGPKQHLVAHLEDGVDPPPVQLLLACLLRGEEQGPDFLHQLFHTGSVGGWGFTGVVEVGE